MFGVSLLRFEWQSKKPGKAFRLYRTRQQFLKHRGVRVAGSHRTMPSRLRRRVSNQERLFEFKINSTLIWQIMGPVILGIFALSL
jgi:hypothetical protein